jgi:hypothetical protein
LRHELSDSSDSSPLDDDYSPSKDDTESPSIESKSTRRGSRVHKLRKEKERQRSRKSDRNPKRRRTNERDHSDPSDSSSSDDRRLNRSSNRRHEKETR